MPGDERATLTPEERASMFIEWCALSGFGCEGWPEGAFDQLVAHIKAADRLAREDAAKALRLYGQHSLSCPAAPGSLQPLDVCQCGLDAAIRASITTDEGE